MDSKRFLGTKVTLPEDVLYSATGGDGIGLRMMNAFFVRKTVEADFGKSEL